MMKTPLLQHQLPVYSVPHPSLLYGIDPVHHALNVKFK